MEKALALLTLFQPLSSLHKRSMAAGTNDVVLRFCNGTHSAVRVLWWDCGQEREYAVLQPGQAYNQSERAWVWGTCGRSCQRGLWRVV